MSLVFNTRRGALTRGQMMRGREQYTFIVTSEQYSMTELISKTELAMLEVTNYRSRNLRNRFRNLRNRFRKYATGSVTREIKNRPGLIRPPSSANPNQWTLLTNRKSKGSSTSTILYTRSGGN